MVVTVVVLAASEVKRMPPPETLLFDQSAGTDCMMRYALSEMRHMVPSPVFLLASAMLYRLEAPQSISVECSKLQYPCPSSHGDWHLKYRIETRVPATVAR